MTEDVAERLLKDPTQLTLLEAADEIERLRKENEELRARVKDLEGVLKWGQGF